MQVTSGVSVDEIFDILKEFKDSSKNRFFSKIGIFGSFARGDDDIYSDVDIVVKVDEDALNKYDVWEYFETIRELKKIILDRLNLNSDIFDIESSSSILDSVKRDVVYV